MNDKELFDYVSGAIERSKKREGQLEGKFDLTVENADASRGMVRFIYRPKADERNVYGGVHGGVTATVFDYTMALPIGALTGAFAGTIQLSIQYLRPMMADEYFIECEALHTGNKVCQGRAMMYDAGTNKAVASAHASYSKVNITRDQLK